MTNPTPHPDNGDDSPNGDRPPFRRRLLLRIGPAVVLALGILALLAWGAAYFVVHENALQTLEAEVQEMRAQVRGRDTLNVSGYAWDEVHHRLAVDRIDPIFVQVFRPDGRLLRQSANVDSLPADFPDHPLSVRTAGVWPRLHTFALDHQTFYYRTRPLQSSTGETMGFVQVVRLAPEHRPILWGFATVLGGLWLLLSAGLLGLVAWAARRVLRPLQSVTEVAQAVTSMDLDERVEVPPTADRETATLGRTFNGLLDQIEEHVAALRAFTANAAHELQTPLTALRGHVELALRRERDAESYRETLRLLDRKLGGLVQSLRALLTLTRLDRTDSLEWETVNLATLAAGIADSFRDSAEEKGVDVSVEAEGPAWVQGQPALLKKAVRNLIDNAVKYTPEGRVEVEVHPADDGRISFTCTDTGVGMTAEDRAEATSRFYRGNESGQLAEGSGLGLSLVQRVVEKHDGELRFDSTSEVGTRVTVLLPAALPPNDGEHTDSTPSTPIERSRVEG